MKIKLISLLLVLTCLTVFSCSSDDKESFNPDDYKIENEDPKKEEKEEEEETDPNETTTVDGIKIGANFLVFEPKVTKSDLGLWVKRLPGDSKYHVGTGIEALNKDYLEFTGNNLNGGTAKSPIAFTFKCPKTAKYRMIMRMYQPLLGGEAGDKRNDIWVKLAGDFTTACVYPTEDLKSNHKFWGRGVRKWGSCLNLEGHVNGVKKLNKVVYNLNKDEEYTFTISSRAQGCSIDYVLFYDESIGLSVSTHDDIAATLPELYRPDIED